MLNLKTNSFRLSILLKNGFDSMHCLGFIMYEVYNKTN